MINKIVRKLTKPPQKLIKKNEIIQDELIDWSWILCLKGVTKYLLINEKNELSHTSRFLRLVIKPLIFKSIDSFNFHHIMGLNNNRSKFSGKNIIDFEIQKFTKKFLYIRDYVYELSIDIGFNTYLLPPIAILCPQLVELNINTLTIPLSTFKVILSGLRHLETLSLVDLTLIEWATSEENDNIDLPPNIKRLATIKCRRSRTTFTEDPLQLGFNYTVHPSKTHYVHFLAKKIAKLEEFAFGGYESKYIFKLNRFLSRHPTIRSLSISIDLIDQPLLNSLSGSRELEELTLIGTTQFPIRINTLEFPNFFHLRQFNFRFSNTCFDPIGTKIYKSFPNILKLTMCYSESFYELFSKLILKSPILETLILLDGSGKASLKSSLPHNNIRTIILKHFDSRLINLNCFKNCLQLRKIVIYNNEFLKNMGNWQQLIELYSRFKNWNCVVHKDFINCYKIKEHAQITRI